jgi:hypothetical protein
MRIRNSQDVFYVMQIIREQPTILILHVESHAGFAIDL